MARCQPDQHSRSSTFTRGRCAGSDAAIADAARYGDALSLPDGAPISTLPQNVIAIETPQVREADELARLANALAEEQPDLIVDSGVLVMIGESESPFVMTNKIIVQIAEGTEPALIQEIAADFDAEVVSENPFDKQQFVIALPEGDVENALRVSNAINERPEGEAGTANPIISATPSFVFGATRLAARRAVFTSSLSRRSTAVSGCTPQISSRGDSPIPVLRRGCTPCGGAGLR